MTTTETETERVFYNRQWLFQSLYFTPTQAATLALNTTVHYYDAKKLLDAGCKHEVVVLILS